MSDTQKTFLLGIGAQKAGTSWLHDMILRSDQADMGFTKEYHIHDARTLPELDRFRAGPLARFEKLQAAGTPPAPDSRLGLRVAFLNDPEAYYDYFAQRVAAPGIRLTGDFTPSYSGLDVATLTHIRDGMQARGVTPRVVFLMRDPVERSWSALRMARRETARKRPGHVFRKSEFEHLRAIYKSDSFQLRANYVATLDRLDRVFAPEARFIDFYETLFAQSVIDRLCDFTGIDRIEVDPDKQVNVSPKTSAIPEDIAAEMATYYSDIYHGLARRFGAAHLRDIWWSAGFVL